MEREIRFPRTEEEVVGRPACCPKCRFARVRINGRERRAILDPQVREVEVVRYFCPSCRHSWREYPEGVKRFSPQSQRQRAMSVTLYVLGLSYEKVSRFLKALGCGMVKSTVWEDVQEMGAEARRRFRRAEKKLGKRAVVGTDETYLKVKGQGIGVGFVTDPQSGELVGMRLLASREGEEMADWLTKTVQRLGCEVVVTDELESYKGAAEQAGLEHQLCLAHWRKAIARRLKKIPGYEKEKALIKEALKELDKAGLTTIRWLHRQFAKAPPPRKGERQSPAYTMRRLLLDCEENWNRLTCYQKKHKALSDDLGRRVKRDYAVPSTNNACENAIGRGGKIRYKAMRGYKRLRSALNTTLLIAAFAGVLAGVSCQSLLT
jgi:transposase-like protein